MSSRSKPTSQKTRGARADGSEAAYADIPSNLDAEQSALCSIFARPERMEEASKELSPAHFHSPDHRAVFSAMLALWSQRRTVEIITVADALERMGKLDEIGGHIRLAEIASGIPGGFHETIRLLQEAAKRRTVIEVGWKLVEGGKNPTRDLSALLEKAHNLGEGRKQSSRAHQDFGFLNLTDLLSAPRPPRWLIRNYIEADTLSVLFGEAGSMKSFLAIDQGLCLASGTPWHGQAIPNPGPVFYLAGEGFHGLSKRIQAWIVAHNADHSIIPFFVSKAPAQFLDKEHAQTVAAHVASLAEQHGQPRLVIVDTLNRNFGDGDENSGQDMGAFVSALDQLKARFGCSVLVVHHSGLADKNRSRGSGVLRAAIDFEYKMAANGTARVLSNTKCKDHEPPQSKAFEPEEVGTGWTDPETLEEITSCVLRQTEMPLEDERTAISGAKRIALDALKQACESAGGSAHIDEWRRIAYEMGISTGTPQARKKAFNRASRDLIGADIVQIENNLCSILPGVHGVQKGYMYPTVPGTRGVHGVHTSLEVYPCTPACTLPAPSPGEEAENPFAEVSYG